MVKRVHMTNTSFSRIYAAYSAQFIEDLPFWLDLAKSCGGSILELGCGPGRVLCALAQEGMTVTGLDHDEDMLQWARSRLPVKLLKQVEFILGDMRNFQLSDRYPLIIVPCNTFAYFDHSDALRMLQCSKQHLTPGGELAIVIPNPAQYSSSEVDPSQNETSETEPIHDFIEPISGNPVQVYAYEKLDREQGILHVSWTFDELLPDGRVQRLHHPVTYYLRSLEEVISLLSDAKMNLKYVYGDYQHGPLGQHSHEMVIVAHSQPEN
jgi:SAM-dependent methyltransferase